MAAKAQTYLQEKKIKGLSAQDVELVGKCIEKFEKLDSIHKDGSLTPDEVKAIVEGTNMVVDSVMSTLDVDGNGKVSLDEFLCGIVLVKSKNLYRPLFNSFDKDNNGTIKIEDLAQVMNGKGYSKDDVVSFINEKGMAVDGKLNYDEFIKYYFKITK